MQEISKEALFPGTNTAKHCADGSCSDLTWEWEAGPRMQVSASDFA